VSHIPNELTLKTILLFLRSDCSDSKHKPWYSDELGPFSRLRDMFYVLRQRFKTNDFYKTEFKKYRNLCVGKTRELKKKYYDNRLKDNMTNIKKLWFTLSEIMPKIDPKRLLDLRSV
jgi:capsule polysaccharide export protein KpsE/RkpR